MKLGLFSQRDTRTKFLTQVYALAVVPHVAARWFHFFTYAPKGRRRQGAGGSHIGGFGSLGR